MRLTTPSTRKWLGIQIDARRDGKTEVPPGQVSAYIFQKLRILPENFEVTHMRIDVYTKVIFNGYRFVFLR